MNNREALKLMNDIKKLDLWLESNGAELLRSYRKKRKMGVNEFARAYNYSPAYISRVENSTIKLGKPLADVILRNTM